MSPGAPLHALLSSGSPKASAEDSIIHTVQISIIVSVISNSPIARGIKGGSGVYQKFLPPVSAVEVTRALIVQLHDDRGVEALMI